MNRFGIIRTTLALATLAGALTLVGCESSQSRDYSRLNANVLEVPRGYARGNVAPRIAAPVAERPAAATPRATTAGVGNCAVDVPAGMKATAMAFPTGDIGSSALMLTEVSPNAVRANAPYETMVYVCNLTQGSLSNVVVTNESISNFNVSASSPAASRGADGTLQWPLGTLAAGETKVIRLQGMAPAVGVASTCLSVSYNNSLCAAVNVVQPALAITKTITPMATLNCDPITTSIEVKNTGTGSADNVKITDNLPDGLTTTSGEKTFTINVGTLASGESKAFPVTLKATKTGTFQNVASVVADGGLTAESQSVTTKITQPVLTISCKSPERVFLGREVAYQFTVTNTGDSACEATTVVASLPAGATNARASDAGVASANSVNWNVGALAAGASKVLTVNFIPTGGAGSNISVSATAACKCAVPVTTQCSTNVFGLPDIGTLVTDDEGVVAVGANHTYRVEVENQGQINLTNVKMVVALPEGMTFVSSANGRLVGNKVEFAFGTLTPGQKVASAFVVKASKSGELLVIGETTCTEIRTPVRDDELTNFVGE